MNYNAIAQMLGKIMYVTGAMLILPIVVSMIYAEGMELAFFAPMATLVVGGFLLSKIPPNKRNVYIGEGFLIVTLSWLIISVFGAVPFVISGYIPSFADAFFETVSGFTTTGSTILTDIEKLPYSLLFWRSFSHWIGGMGVLVFLLALTTGKDMRTMYIMRAESPGPKAGKLVSKMKHTARIMYLIYVFLTVLLVFFLSAGGMPVFDAIVNAFATAGTGGFAIKNASIAAYNSVYAEYVIAVFMVLFGANFGIYFLLLRGKFKDMWKNEEVRWYAAIILAATVIIALIILPEYGVGNSVRKAFFTVSSTISTTGFVVENYELWPTAAKMIIFFLMFIGGCTSSTGGGMKVLRIMVLAKIGLRELKLAGSPRTVKSISIDKKAVDPEIVRGISAYLIVYVFVMSISIILISFDDVSLIESISSVVTCLNNVGPGFERLGAVGNFSHLSDFSKLILSVDMLMGRLELFPILALLKPSLWKV